MRDEGGRERSAAAGTPLPFRLLPPCRRNKTTSCLPSSTRSAQWRLPVAPLPLPPVPEAALRLACGPLRVHALSSREAILNRSFWSSWLKWDASGPQSEQLASRERRCVQRLRSWRPRVCEARDVWVAGAAQVMFNASGYLGPAKRVAATLQGVRGVQASREHVMLTRNEYGAGYYHVLYDTLASLAVRFAHLAGRREARLPRHP